nr:methyl-accepting chemotaxis protein [Thiospirillum jenense]
MYATDEFEEKVETEVQTARNVLLMSEAVRENMAEKWRLGLFSPDTVRALTGATERERLQKVFATIPVVTAWESAKAKAEQGGFVLRTPRRDARNSDNEPDAIEQLALDYFANHRNAEEYYVVDEKTQTVRYFRPVRLANMCLYCHGDPAQSKTLWGTTDGTDVTGYRMENKRVGDLHGAFEIVKDLKPGLAERSERLWGMIAVMAGVVLITILLIGWLTRRLVSQPIDAAVSAMIEAQRTGDLTFRLLPQKSDELGRMAEGFNQFIAKIQSLVKAVASSAGELSSATQQVSQITAETNQGVRQQQSETDQVATAMNQMTATVEAVAQNAHAAAQAAQQADSASAQGQRVVQQTLEAINLLAHEVERASTVIAKLETNSESIGAVVDVIKGIADQTNLLALNAAIEAARAGEQGRGFAVVADEVRTLASRTQQSTREIQQMIEQLQAGANEAVSAMHLGQQQAQDSVNKAQDAGAALGAITDSVATIADMNHQIASAAEQQSAVAEEINRNIINISQVADRTSSGAEQTTRATERLAELARRLRTQLDQFHV